MARMLCIKGSAHRQHTGLQSGTVYDVTIGPSPCGCKGTKGLRAFAEGSVFKAWVHLRCHHCLQWSRRYVGMVPWGTDRFVPWSDPKVSISEVKRLYSPAPREKEKA